MQEPPIIRQQPVQSSATNKLAALSLLLAATLWGVFWYPLRVLAEMGLHGLWATVLIYLGAMLVILPYLLYKRVQLFPREPIILLLMLSSGWCNLAFILALLQGEVVRVLLLFYLSPLWAILLGYFWLRETLSRYTYRVVFVAMIGAVVMLWDARIGMPWPRDGADLLALTAGIAFAVMNASIRKAQHLTVPAKLVYVWLGVLMVAGLGIVFVQPVQPAIPLPAGLLAISVGATLIVLMTVTVQYGVTHLPLQSSAIILLFEIVAGAVSAGLLTNEVLGWQDWIGGGLVILAAYLAARRI